MVSIMDVEPKRQICDTRATLSQSAVSQKSIDLDISLKSPTSPTARSTNSGPTEDEQASTSSSPLATTSTRDTVATTVSAATDTELAKRTMKLDLVDATSVANTASSSASAASTTQSSTSTSAATTTTAIIMKHRKLKERTFSDEIGSPKSPASASGRGATRTMVQHQTSLTSQVEVVDDRKALRDALYQGIFHRHRRTIFAVGSFLRMLKSRNSSYNTIRSSSEGEDDTR